MCLPLHPRASFAPIDQLRAAGLNYVSINVGMDMNPVSQILSVIAGYRATIAAHPEKYALVNSVADGCQDVEHGRNISDAQIRACAATGGVVGVSRFLGNPKPSALDVALQHGAPACYPGGLHHQARACPTRCRFSKGRTRRAAVAAASRVQRPCR